MAPTNPTPNELGACFETWVRCKCKYVPTSHSLGRAHGCSCSESQSVSHTLIYITYLSPSPSLDVLFIKHNNTTRRTTRFVQESLVTVQIIAPALPYIAIYQPFSNNVLQALLTPGF
ncbi:N-carbamoyl-L-amino acid hydrolase [Fusarium oxysporum f. sp. albedinis]|nr:N-carbamoyl-L-amino acid hydrolase [Fusarium oxysporum f. sp. albedinis]